ALALDRLGRSGKAEAAIRQATVLEPGYVEGWFALGNLLREGERHDEAEAAYLRAREIAPDDARVLYNLGLTLLKQGRARETIETFEAALARAPEMVEAHMEIGNALVLLGDQEGAEARYRRVLASAPDHVLSLTNLGRALAARRRFDDACVFLARATALPGADATAFAAFGEVLLRVRRTADGEKMLRRALELDPEHGDARAALAMVLQWQCRWDELDAIQPGLVAHSLAEARAGRRSPIAPHTALSQFLTPAQEKLIAESWSRAQTIAMRAAETGGPFVHRERQRDRIRLGYFSNDFNSQATAHLIVGLFERHDRDRFEIHAYSFGADDGSSWRRRIEAASDAFVDVTEEGYAETAARMHRDGVDILLDFKGFTAESRPQVYALRPAPIQVNYLGFPGTIGADYMDYLVADEIVIPPGEREHYTEKVVYLPESYQANDDRQEIGDWPATRADAGLPESGIVFSCFNETYKFDRTIFGVWMRILDRVPGSVLWLRDHDARLRASLREAAEGAGVSEQRLLFAESLPKEQHLARCRLADLFLDSYALTAHTTATDSLWAGVPMITCPRNTFATRVGQSLLENLELPELVVPDLDAYEALAVRVATSPDELAALRAKLAGKLKTAPLFDTARLTRHLEAAFAGMWERYRDGRPPESFRVPPQPREW
ncbi:MAG: tetratricopeptide repeat protein, partial [Alphaproteobacteria bacterium]|nr:tetratricopeptide repeat protein [Alphaproteobacteria bacterium]